MTNNLSNKMNSNIKYVIKRDGRKEPVCEDKIFYRIQKLINDEKLGVLDNVSALVIAKDVIEEAKIDNITTTELDNIASRIALQNTLKLHLNYNKLAIRIMMSNLHKNTTECFSTVMESLFNNINSKGEVVPIINERFINVVRQHKHLLNEKIDYTNDYNFTDFFGLKTLEDKYLLRKFKGKTDSDNEEITILAERPMHLIMRVAIGIHYEDIDNVIKSYDLMSKGYFTHATPTLFNSGTVTNQMSSCFILKMDDSMDKIYKNFTDCALISKSAGGIGMSFANLRPEGSFIRGTNGKSKGIVKILKVANATANFANQGGKRNGSFAIYNEPWHGDIYDFLDAGLKTGDESHRARDLFYGLWIPNAFMEAVKTDADWYLMNPDLCKGLTEAYGKDFNKLYYSYVEKGMFIKKIKARDLFVKICNTQINTGMPYMSFKDAVNEKSNQQNLGTIQSSNLCVAPETMILTSKGYFKISELQDKSVMVWNGQEFTETVVKKTGNNQKLLKVKLSNGNELECTPYHNFYVYDSDNKIKKVEARHLLKGTKLINKELPIIKEGLDKETGDSNPYLIGQYCDGGLYRTGKFNAEYIIDIFGDMSALLDSKHHVVPINYNIDFKLEWLAGFFDNELEVHNKKLSVIIKNIQFITDVKYLLQTLSCESIIDLNESRLYIEYHQIIKILNLNFIEKCLNIHTYFSSDLDVTMKTSIKVDSVIHTERISDTYCFKEEKRGMGVFNGVLTGQCNEINIYHDADEYGTCNIATVSLPKFVENGVFNFKALYDVVKVMVLNLNRVIDNNYYPVPETKNSNLKHRPTALGTQGLSNTFFLMKYPFDSESARKLNKDIFETIQFAALESSMELSIKEGKYSSFEGSPSSKGIFQHNMWGVKNEDLPRYPWDELKEKIIKHGLRNSLLTASPPTASTSQILGNYESFEPINSNVFTRTVLSGDFTIINTFLIEDLTKLKLWNDSMYQKILKHKGSVQNIPEIPQNIKDMYKTVWEIKQKTLIDYSTDRAMFTDQTQSLNLYVPDATVAKMSTLHMYAYQKGLKTGMYYLRTKTKAQQIHINTEVDVETQPEEPAGSDVCYINSPECSACSG